MSAIADLSHHNTVNWSVAHKELDFAILRVQDGSRVIDREYQKNVTGCKAYGVPFGNYAFCRFVSESDARVEARHFWERGDKGANIWFADIEVDTMSDMKAGTQAFIDELYRLGAKRVGVYVGHHKYKQYQVDKLQRVDVVWIPRYGGKKPDFPCQLWQYTETGKVNGITGHVDLNHLHGGFTLQEFIGKPKHNIIQSGAFRREYVEDVMGALTSVKMTANFILQSNGLTYFVTEPTSDKQLNAMTEYLDRKGWYYDKM